MQEEKLDDAMDNLIGQTKFELLFTMLRQLMVYAGTSTYVLLLVVPCLYY